MCCFISAVKGIRHSPPLFLLLLPFYHSWFYGVPKVTSSARITISNSIYKQAEQFYWLKYEQEIQAWVQNCLKSLK